jgi:beta-glucosidase
MSVGLALCAVLATTVIVPTAASATSTDPPWMSTTLSANERAELLVATLSLEEKATLLIQTGGPGLPEYGVPAIRGKDASNGVSVDGGSTALPVGLALASSWDARLATRYGTVAGTQTREAGYNSAAAPSIDLTRAPWGGRIWEGLGEDPLLSGRLGAAQTNGVQSADVPAEAKHYNVYNAESRRGHVDVVVDERTLQEVYTRPWETVVRDANVASVMCSFNRVNGEYACSSEYLLSTILKEQLALAGFVQTDFNAGKGFGDYTAGLDTAGEQLDYSGENLVRAVNAGIVSEERVTDAARRVLYTMFEFGIIDNPPVNSFVTPFPGTTALSAETLEAGAPVAVEAGEKGIVLLKNAGNALPVSSDVSSVAVIGAGADEYIDGGGSAAVTTPNDLTTIVDGITERAGDGVTVEFAPGTDDIGLGDTLPGPAPIPSSVLRDVQATYRGGADSPEGPIFLQRSEAQINLRTGLSADVGNNTSQVPGVGFPTVLTPTTNTWMGTLVAPADGTYGLALTSLGTSELYLDDQLVLTNAATTVETASVDVPLVAGQSYAVRVEYTTDAPNQFDGSLNDQPGAMIRLGWVPPAGVVSPQIAEAVELARTSQVAVVVVRDYTGEAGDRASLSLPQDQDRLISEVAAVNPRTIVVLATGGASTMPWVDAVPAVVQSWYGGQAQGETLASVLFGDVNPSGHLPITFPVSEEQVLQTGVQNPFDYVEELAPTVNYAEGIHIGYRGYVKDGLTPLFPFGHGLSYTEFDYDDAITTTPVDPGQTDPVAGTASVTVTNTGAVSGTETVQLYVGALPTPLDTADRALAGWAQVTLQPGETREVAVPIDRRSLQYWDAEQDTWVTPAGTVKVVAGRSVTDVRATGSLTVAVPDTTAPTLAVEVDPAEPTGTNGWYRDPVTLTFRATDNADPAPVVQVAVDGGEYAPAIAPVVISDDGVHAVEARAVDAAGNESAVQTTTVQIDRTAPVVTASKSSAYRLSLAAEDPASGVASTEYRYVVRFGSHTYPSTWREYRRSIPVIGRWLQVEYRATDAAGNLSSVGVYP